MNGEVNKIVVSRPTVEVGKTLGWLPGDEVSKMHPYMRPILSELQCFVDYQDIANFINEGKLEICSLGLLRGRTLKNAFIILEEGQNALREELLMFVTRLGEGSKMVINGDLSQQDIASNLAGGFSDLIGSLRDLPGVAQIHFDSDGIIRHELIGPILERLKNYIR